jgi:hypothetical protein
MILLLLLLLRKYQFPNTSFQRGTGTRNSSSQTVAAEL